MPKRIPKSRFYWNPKAQRFAMPTKGGGYTFLSEKRWRDVIDRDIKHAGERMVSHGDDLRTAARKLSEGSISQAEFNAVVKQWRDKMAEDIKAQHYGQAVAAKGGFQNMTQRDHGWLGSVLKEQYAYLEKFATEICEAPDMVYSVDPKKMDFDQRVSMYSEASRATFETMSDTERGANGFPWLINILEANANHCKPDKRGAHSSCPGQTALGPVRYDDARRIVPGHRACKVFCLCNTMRFKTKAAARKAMLGEARA